MEISVDVTAAKPKLDVMSIERVMRWVSVPGAILGMLSCGGRDQPARVDSGVDTTAIAQAAARAPSEWVSELGQLLVVPSDSEHAAVVIFPDFPSARLVASAPMTLINASGDTVSARAELVATESEQCGGAPLVRLADGASDAWSIGLLRGSATPLRMDSIAALPPADSTRAVADIARLASALTANRESRFSGLPFTVLGAHRVNLGDSEALIAHVVRRVPQEASPLEEHTFIIAERPTNAAANAPWTAKYSQKSEGSEDTADHFTVLAAVRAGDKTLLILARDQLERTRYEILERSPAGTWRSRWSRTLVC